MTGSGRGPRFSYVLAFLGAHLAFIPLLGLLLPRRITAIDPANAVQTLSLLLLIGGITASISHILAGRWSDHFMRRHGNRRAVIAIGVAGLAATILLFAFSTTLDGLIVAIVLFQATLNIMFAPLGALLADHVPDTEKGRVAGWLNAALPLSNAGTSLIAFLAPQDGIEGFLLVLALMAATILPLLLNWPFANRLGEEEPDGARTGGVSAARADFARVWIARLIIQVGAAFVFGYFYLFLATMTDAAEATRRMGLLAGGAMMLSLVASVAAGHWSDRAGRRGPITIAALFAAAGLALMAFNSSWPMLAIGYLAFQAGLIAFLSIDAAMVAQLVSSSDRRGELLGYVNLTNTLPAIAVPAVSLAVAERLNEDFWPILFAAAALLALVAGVLVTRVRTIR